MNNQGWIKIHRKILDSSFYKKSEYIHLFFHLVLTANHAPKKFLWNHKEIVVARGQLVTGRKALSEQTGISEQTIRSVLVTLKSTSTITIKSTNKYSLITILNYEQYQESTSTFTNEQPATNQQLTTNNNDKNDKNVNKERETHASLNYLQSIPDNDLQEYCSIFNCSMQQIKIKGEQLYNYCLSKGRTYKNYKALLRNALDKDFKRREKPLLIKKSSMTLDKIIKGEKYE